MSRRLVGSSHDASTKEREGGEEPTARAGKEPNGSNVLWLEQQRAWDVKGGVADRSSYTAQHKLTHAHFSHATSRTRDIHTHTHMQARTNSCKPDPGRTGHVLTKRCRLQRIKPKACWRGCAPGIDL